MRAACRRRDPKVKREYATARSIVRLSTPVACAVFEQNDDLSLCSTLLSPPCPSSGCVNYVNLLSTASIVEPLARRAAMARVGLAPLAGTMTPGRSANGRQRHLQCRGLAVCLIAEHVRPGAGEGCMNVACASASKARSIVAEPRPFSRCQTFGRNFPAGRPSFHRVNGSFDGG
jgi:hypothetical protein